MDGVHGYHKITPAIYQREHCKTVTIQTQNIFGRSPGNDGAQRCLRAAVYLTEAHIRIGKNMEVQVYQTVDRQVQASSLAEFSERWQSLKQFDDHLD